MVTCISITNSNSNTISTVIPLLYAPLLYADLYYTRYFFQNLLPPTNGITNEITSIIRGPLLYAVFSPKIYYPRRPRIIEV